jgi:alkaline phosphatase
MAEGPPHISSRRDFLRQGAAAGVLLGTGAAPGSLSAPHAPSSSPARNVIFMVSDGMSIGTLTLADMFIRMQQDRSSHWVQLWSRPGARRAHGATFAANSLVTDSAAASSAYSIGERVNNGAICITPDGREPVPILVRARRRGLATGLVTTTRLTHATPAAFVANVGSRNQEPQIAAQMLERGVDVALGGGALYFPRQGLAEQQDLAVVRTRTELLNLGAHVKGRVLGLFSDSHMAYEIDRSDQEPTLAEMTRFALSILAARPGGFLAQIEGGRIDHAAHNNDIAALLRDQIAFDDALGVAVDFAAARDDTLLIVTTDHGNGNPGLTIYGPEGTRRFGRISQVRQSFEWIGRQLRDDAGAPFGALSEVVSKATGVRLEEAELDHIARLRRGEPVHPFSTANSFYPVLGALLANHLGVSFMSPNHTSDFVEVAAMGPGSENLRPMIDITELHTVMAAALALPAPA